MRRSRLYFSMWLGSAVLAVVLGYPGNSASSNAITEADSPRAVLQRVSRQRPENRHGGRGRRDADSATPDLRFVILHGLHSQRSLALPSVKVCHCMLSTLSAPPLQSGTI